MPSELSNVPDTESRDQVLEAHLKPIKRPHLSAESRVPQPPKRCMSRSRAECYSSTACHLDSGLLVSSFVLFCTPGFF